MKHKGIELKEVTEPQVFDPPRKMLVIDELDDEPQEKVVVAIAANGASHNVIVERRLGKYEGYQRCFEIPEEPKPRRATNREVARWLTEGRGQVYCVGAANSHTFYSYQEGEDDTAIYANMRVRKWGDTEWHEPTADYMGLEADK